MHVGSVLGGKYRIDRVLGQGGMGIVVEAMHLQLGQPVAMKFLLPEVAQNQGVVQRFLREAQAAVRLKSEHVARVIDVGTHEDGAPFMVLEYLDGLDLAHFPRSQMTVGLIIDLMLQACEALADAHAIGIVHRDIKPGNFFITRRTDGSLLLKVLDFGISKAPTALESNLTGTQTVMGTPAYMSPEQMRSSRDVDNRSDIWSLGVVLYELLQGAPPFEAETFSGMVIKVATEPLPPMSVHLPQGLPEIVYRCLERDLTRRFQDVAELAHALSRYAGSTVQAAVSVERTSRVLGTQPPVTRPATDPPPRGAPSTITSAAGAVTQAPTKSRWPTFAAASAVVVVGAIIAIVAVTGPSGGGDGARSATQPEPVKPEPVRPEPVVARPEPVKPEPVVVKPEPVKPEPVVAKPEPVKPEPVVAKPEPVKPAPPKKPRTVKPKVTPVKPPATGGDDILDGRR